jgi:phosphohistidine phosphatase
MERLIIMRHAIAQPRETPGLEDDDRVLIPKGKKRLRTIARGLSKLELDLDKIVASPLPRTRETAEILARELGLEENVEFDDVLRPSSDAATIRDWIHTRSEERLMIVGHDPAVSHLTGLLVTGDHSRPIFSLRKGGVVAFRAHPVGGFQLEWLARPRLFRRLQA